MVRISTFVSLPEGLSFVCFGFDQISSHLCAFFSLVKVPAELQLHPRYRHKCPCPVPSRASGRQTCDDSPTSCSFTWHEGPSPPSSGLSGVDGSMELDGVGTTFLSMRGKAEGNSLALLQKESTLNLKGDQDPEPGFNPN